MARGFVILESQLKAQEGERRHINCPPGLGKRRTVREERSGERGAPPG